MLCLSHKPFSRCYTKSHNQNWMLIHYILDSIWWYICSGMRKYWNYICWYILFPLFLLNNENIICIYFLNPWKGNAEDDSRLGREKQIETSSKYWILERYIFFLKKNWILHGVCNLYFQLFYFIFYLYLHLCFHLFCRIFSY